MNPLNIITRDNTLVRTGIENPSIIVQFNSGISDKLFYRIKHFELLHSGSVSAYIHWF